MITKIAKSLPIRFLVLCMSISVILLAKATEGYSTLSQGTNGTREVSTPDPQSSIPSDLLTTPSSLTRDRSDHDVVDEDGHDDDRCHHQATEAWICRNHYVTDLSPPHVDVHTDGNPAVTGGITTEIRTLEEEEEEVEDDDDSFTLGNTLVGLTFEAAVFLMLSSVQPPRGNSTSLLATWSPSWSRSPPPSLPISLSASFPLTMALLAIVIGLTVGLMGRMMLRRGHAAVARVCKYACILSFAAAFYSMTYGLVADNFAWAIWAAAGFLFLVFAYCIAQR